MSRKSKPELQCLIPGCERTKLRCRGLCGSCYNTASIEVKKGTTSWDKLVKAGLALEAHSGTRSPATIALRAITGKAKR